MKKNVLVFIAAVLLVVIGTVYFAFNKNTESTIPTSNNEVKNDVVQMEQLAPTSLTIYTSEQAQSYPLTEYVGNTVLDATKKVTNGNMETQGEGVNAFVISINERTADIQGKEFWELIVNGKPSEVGAGSYVIKEGDSIEWKISTF